MAKKFSTPGITLTEKDISQVVSPAGTSVGLIVGKATKGIAHTRALMTSDKEVIATFGTPISSATSDFGIYGALQFLQESNAMYFTRALNGDEAYSNAYFPVSTQTNGYSAVSATTVTAWGTSAYTTGALEADEANDIAVLDAFTDIATSGGSLLVASIGAGVYGNNVGVSLQTCATSYSTTTSSNSADWAWSYDTPEADGTPSSASDAIWKKIIKLNVYVRTTSSDAFSTTPIETFYGTIGNNLAPDGSQLNITQIINGVSKYIYVSPVNMTSGLVMEQHNALALANGADTTSEVGVTNITGGLDFYTDKEKVSMNIVIGTYKNDTVNTKIGTLTNGRKDCIGTIQIGTSTELTPSTLIGYSNDNSFSSPSYLAKYVGWSLVYDSYSDVKLYIPNSIFGASVMAKTDNVANTWNAPAGINRGILPVLGQNVKFNDTQIGQLYDANLNTVKFIKGYGNVLWGQRTAQRTVSALREIAVRRMLLLVEGTIEPGLLPFVFEPNVDSVRLRIFSIIDNFLSQIKAGGGLDDYNVVVDDSNNSAQDKDNNVLNVDIYVQPVHTIEFINVQVVITRSGISLAEVAV